MTGRLVTAREVAERLGFSAETILRWSRRGDFEGVAVLMPGGAVRFREDRLDAWIEERATTGRGVLATPRDAAQRLGYPVLATPEDEED